MQSFTLYWIGFVVLKKSYYMKQNLITHVSEYMHVGGMHSSCTIRW